jgi:hypothetical protein
VRIRRSCFVELRLCNAGAVSMEDDVEDALRDLAGELGMTRNDTTGSSCGSGWSRIPIYDEDGDVDGTARSR